MTKVDYRTIQKWARSLKSFGTLELPEINNSFEPIKKTTLGAAGSVDFIGPLRCSVLRKTGPVKACRRFAVPMAALTDPILRKSSGDAARWRGDDGFGARLSSVCG
jgi:hypothetical protein